MDFFNNKDNDILKFKINSTGVDTSTIETRLVLKSNENKNYVFFGTIIDETCSFEIPNLSLYENNTIGNVKFEIISGDMYFNVWSDQLNIKSKVESTLEKIEEEVNKVIRPNFTASTIQPETVKKDVKPEIVKESVKPKEEKIIKPEIVEKEVKEETIQEKENINETNNIKTDISDDEVKSFSDFFKNKNN